MKKLAIAKALAVVAIAGAAPYSFAQTSRAPQ